MNQALTKFKHQQPSDNTLISNIQCRMRLKSVSEAQLSRQTHIPQPTLHKILSGKTHDPRISTLKALADFFDTTLDELYNQKILSSVKTTPQGQYIPRLQWNECIKNLLINEKNFAKKYWIGIEPTNADHLFALTSKPAMEPRFIRGTILIVSRNFQPQDGDFVVVHYTKTQEATIRELCIDGPDQLLQSINKPIISDKLDEDKIILGTLIQSRFEHKDLSREFIQEA